MARDITISHSSDCPYTNQKQTVKITYVETPILGSLTSGYKLSGFSCPHKDECPYPSQSQTGYCPVVDAASERP